MSCGAIQSGFKLARNLTYQAVSSASTFSKNPASGVISCGVSKVIKYFNDALQKRTSMQLLNTYRFNIDKVALPHQTRLGAVINMTRSLNETSSQAGKSNGRLESLSEINTYTTLTALTCTAATYASAGTSYTGVFKVSQVAACVFNLAAITTGAASTVRTLPNTCAAFMAKSLDIVAHCLPQSRASMV